MNNSPFGFEKPEDSPGFLLWQTTTLWQRKIKRVLEPYKITHSQFVILAILLWFKEKNHPSSQADLIKMSKLDKMTISNSLKKLAKMDLVARQESEKDTRSKIVTLTDLGHILAKELVPMIEELDSQFFGKLGRKESKDFTNMLNQLTK